MNISLLRFKKVLHTTLFVLLLSVAGMDKMYAYDFSAVCPSGQTLYYNIVDSVNHYVELTCSVGSSGSIGGQPWGYVPYWYNTFIGSTWDAPPPSGDVVLPETVEYNDETFTLVSIGEEAFINCSELTSVTIPNSVTTIGYAAFYECISLTSITLPESLVSIGSSVFVRCTSLESIEIPNAVTSIGDYAFSCSGIKHLEIPSSVTTIGEELCAACEDLISVVLPNTVTFINDHAFVWCGSLKELIVFAETPPTLGFDVFFDHGGFYKSSKGTVNVVVPCGFEDAYASLSWGEFNNFYGMCGGTVTVVADPEEGGTVIGEGTIEENSFCTVTAIANEGYTFEHWELSDGTVVSNAVEYTFIVYNDIELVAHFVSNDNIVFADANVKSICINHWDSNNDGELSYAEAASVTDLGDYFQSNLQITSFNELQYFTGLSSIGDAAFMSCTKLSSIVLPNSLTSIGNCAFCSCSRLTGSLTFPNFLTSIGDSAFNECSRLTGSLTFPNFLTLIGDYAFYGCSNLTGSLTFPYYLTSLGDYAFYGCSNLTGSLTFPNFLTSIGNSVFEYCSGLTGDLIIPNSVTSIGNYAFQNCSSFDAIIVETGNTVYDSRGNCNALIVTGTNKLILGCKNSIIPNTVTSIGYYAFYNCSGLTGDLIIPNSVTSIGSSAFRFCTGLTSLTLPNSVTSIGGFAFYYCSGLTGDLIIPNSVTSIGDYAFSGCSGLTFLTIGNSVTSIGSSAFRNCSGLTSLTIGNSVSSIGDYAFSGCSGLTSLTVFAETPPTLGYSSFYNVNKEIPMYVPCGSSEAYQSAEYWNEFTNIQEVCSQQTIALAQGWNWFSTNLEITLDDLKAVLVAALGTNASITIKSQTQNCKLTRGLWTGQLTTLDLSKMYMIMVDSACEITLQGLPINPAQYPFTIINGVNWIAFPLSESMSINEALAGFPAVDNDIIKSKTNNTIYIRGAWRGALTTFEPGQGYKFISNAQENRTLTFPTNAK